MIATGIESIVGGKGTLTVHFRDGGGTNSLPVLAGRVTGEEVALDYSSIRPEKLPAAEGQPTRTGLDMDLATASWAFDPVLGTVNAIENASGDASERLEYVYNAIFDLDESTEYRNSLDPELTAWLPRQKAVFGRADLITGGHDIAGIEAWVSYWGTEAARDFVSSLDITNADILSGTSGDDVIKGSGKDDLFIGMGGNDSFDGRRGKRSVFVRLHRRSRRVV